MHSRLTVVFDACVFYPATLRNMLLQLATTGMFRARWTMEIHDEWMRSLLRDKPDIDPAKLEDFRDEVLEQYGATVQHPDEFITHLIDLDPGTVCHAVKTVRSRLKAPAFTPAGLLDRLHAQGLLEAATRFRGFVDLL